MYMSYYQLLADINSPKKKWGPADPENRGHRYKLDEFDVEITVEANKDKVSLTCATCVSTTLCL